MPPIKTSKIIGGSLFVAGPTRVTFAIETNEFALQFKLADTGSILIPHVTSSGMTLNCSANLSGDSLGFGVVDFGGQVFAKRWYAGSLVIKAVPVVVPGGAGPVRVATTFKLTGNLIAYPSSPVVDPPPPTFQYKLTGHGTVTTRLGAPISTARDVTSYFYDFE
jgi:hypothetical protein